MSRGSPKKTKYLPLILIGLGLVVIIGIILSLPKTQGSSPERNDVLILAPIEVDQPAPELTLYDLDGNEVSLSDFIGEVVLLNNWATWCPPCRQEMPEFKAYYDQHRQEGFKILAVEAGEPENEVRSFVEAAGLNFVFLLDPENQSLVTFQNTSLPNSYVIDRRGHLRLAWLGAINGPTLEKYVTPLLKE